MLLQYKTIDCLLKYHFQTLQIKSTNIAWIPYFSYFNVSMNLRVVSTVLSLLDYNEIIALFMIFPVNCQVSFLVSPLSRPSQTFANSPNGQSAITIPPNYSILRAIALISRCTAPRTRRGWILLRLTNTDARVHSFYEPDPQREHTARGREGKKFTKHSRRQPKNVLWTRLRED